MSAHLLVKLLRAKHAEDVFIPECKDGPTVTGSHFRLDVWAMQMSWSHPTTTGYECKVTRNDFLRDDKWQAYLPLCSDFYFVCPWGLIQPEEVGAPAGLYWASKAGERLWLKKKAQRRSVEIPENMWRYIVMRLAPLKHRTTAEEWAAWLAQKEQELDIGHKCSRRLREVISEKVVKASTDNHRLAKENEALADIKKAMEALGVSIHAWNAADRAVKKMEEMNAVFTPEFLSALRSARAKLDDVLKMQANPEVMEVA